MFNFECSMFQISMFNLSIQKCHRGTIRGHRGKSEPTNVIEGKPEGPLTKKVIEGKSTEIRAKQKGHRGDVEGNPSQNKGHRGNIKGNLSQQMHKTTSKKQFLFFLRQKGKWEPNNKEKTISLCV